MNVERFLAARMASEASGEGRLGRISRHIAWISVCVSIAVMIVAVAVVDGFKNEIREKATGFMGSVLLVAPGQSPMNELYPFTENLSYRDSILSIRGVRTVSGVAYRTGMIRSDGGMAGVSFKGVDSLYDLSFFRKSLVRGELPSFGGGISESALISQRLASRMGYDVGDSMLSYFVGDKVKVRKFTVCGIFDAQLEDIDNSFVLIDRRQVQRLSGWRPDEVSSIEIGISPSADIDATAWMVEQMEFSSSSEEDPGLFVTSVRKIFYNLFDWLALLDLNVVMVLVLMMAVAGFNMVSAVLIILFENIPVIGLLKSLGMSDNRVGKVFLWRSAAIVGKGVLWGSVLGLGICLVQKLFKPLSLDPANYFVKYVPIEFDWLKIILIDIISAIVIMAVLSLATRLIARVSPDRTMRVE